MINRKLSPKYQIALHPGLESNQTSDYTEIFLPKYDRICQQNYIKCAIPIYSEVKETKPRPVDIIFFLTYFLSHLYLEYI